MATLYFNSNTVGGGFDGDWSNPSNWWSDDLFTIPAGATPIVIDDAIINDTVLLDTAGLASSIGVNECTFRGGVTFDPNAVGLTLTTQANCQFYDSCVNYGNIANIGDAAFHDSSSNYGNINGNSSFNDYSASYGGILNATVLYGNASASNTIFYGLATFNYPSLDGGGNSYNAGVNFVLPSFTPVNTNGTAYVDPNGNDSTAVFNDPNNPFATGQGALNIMMQYLEYGILPGYAVPVTSNNCVIHFNAGSYGNLIYSGNWPSNIQLKGDGNNVSSIGDIYSNTISDGYGIGSNSVNIVSDSSVSIANIFTANGTNNNYDGGAGSGGNITATGVYVSGVIATGSGGYGDNGGGGGGSISITGSDVGSGVVAGSGGNSSNQYTSGGWGGGIIIDSSNIVGGLYSGNGGFGFDCAGAGDTTVRNSSTISGDISNGYGGSGYAGIGDPAVDGSPIYVSDSSVGGNLSSGSAGSHSQRGGNGGSIYLLNATIQGSLYCTDGTYNETGGQSGGGLTMTGSSVGGTITLGNGGLAYYYAGGSGGSATINSSTFNPFHAGFGGLPEGTTMDIIYMGAFGTISVDSSTPYFTYPATQATSFVGGGEMGIGDWGYIVNWRDANGNYASVLPDSTTDITISAPVNYDSTSSAVCNNAIVESGGGFNQGNAFDSFANITATGSVTLKSGSFWGNNYNAVAGANPTITGNVIIAGGLAYPTVGATATGNLTITTTTPTNFGYFQSGESPVNIGGSVSISVPSGNSRPPISISRLLELPFFINV